MKKSVSFRLIIVQSMFRRKLLIYWSKRGERIILHFQLVCTKPRHVLSIQKQMGQSGDYLDRCRASCHLRYDIGAEFNTVAAGRSRRAVKVEWQQDNGGCYRKQSVNHDTQTVNYKSKKRKEWLVKKLTVERLLKPINHCCAYLFRTELECGLWLGVFLS